MKEHPYFDPSDPFAPLPPKAPEPPPKGKGRAGPGRGHLVLTVLSIAGLAVCFPVVLQLKAMNESGDAEIPITGPLVLQAIGFVLSLAVFAGTLGVRVVHWIANVFVNLLFNLDGGGWTWEERRRLRREAEEREAKGPRRPGPGTGFDA